MKSNESKNNFSIFWNRPSGVLSRNKRNNTDVQHESQARAEFEFCVT
ncbi:MAG: hypothetical protein NTX86_03835 [Candidatus Dependentiae bacterium]|nr:hypothetical protein [Candidatus Dependentiae bacterium]